MVKSILSKSAPALGRHALLIIGAAAIYVLLAPFSAIGGQQGHGHGHSESIAMEAIVVTAERIDDYVERNPNQVVVLDQKEIRQRNLLSVEEALSVMPGVDVKRSSGVGARISIRGSGKSGSVLVLVNGRPLNSSQYGGVELSTIAIDMVKSIMVFKPPVPVWLGPGASDGAINIVIGNGANEQKEKNTTRLHTAGGSYGLVEGSISHQAKLDSGAVMATATGKHRDGQRTNSDRDGYNLSLHWDRDLPSDRRLELDGRYYASEYGSAGPLDNPTPDAHQSYQKTSFDSRLKGFIEDSGDYSLNFYWDSIYLKDKSQSGSTATLDNVKWGLKGENTWFDDEEVWTLRLSGIMERNEADHTISGTHHRTTAGLGAQIDRNWKAIALTLGLRGDYTSDFDCNPGFSGGLSHDVTDHWSIKANVGYAVNIPTFGQLYQPSHGSIDQVRGNPDLDEEKVWSYDASAVYQRNKSHMFQVSFFRSETRNPIVYQRGIDLVYQPINVNRAWRQGVEATLKYEFDAGVATEGSVIIQDSGIGETDDELPYTPQVKVQLSLRYTLKKPGTRLETKVRYYSEQYSEVENRTTQRIDDYTAVDFKAIQPFKFKKVAAQWFVNIDNLFDAEYEIHYGYPDDGIRFVSGLNLTF